MNHIQTEHLPHAIIVDCSSDPAVAARHAHWLATGTHVVVAHSTNSTRLSPMALSFIKKNARAHVLFDVV